MIEIALHLVVRAPDLLESGFSAQCLQTVVVATCSQSYAETEVMTKHAAGKKGIDVPLIMTLLFAARLARHDRILPQPQRVARQAVDDLPYSRAGDCRREGRDGGGDR